MLFRPNGYDFLITVYLYSHYYVSCSAGLKVGLTNRTVAPYTFKLQVGFTDGFFKREIFKI